MCCCCSPPAFRPHSSVPRQYIPVQPIDQRLSSALAPTFPLLASSSLPSLSQRPLRTSPAPCTRFSTTLPPLIARSCRAARRPAQPLPPSSLSSLIATIPAVAIAPLPATAFQFVLTLNGTRREFWTGGGGPGKQLSGAISSSRQSPARGGSRWFPFSDGRVGLDPLWLGRKRGAASNERGDLQPHHLPPSLPLSRIPDGLGPVWPERAMPQPRSATPESSGRALAPVGAACPVGADSGTYRTTELMSPPSRSVSPRHIPGLGLLPGDVVCALPVWGILLLHAFACAFRKHRFAWDSERRGGRARSW